MLLPPADLKHYSEAQWNQQGFQRPAVLVPGAERIAQSLHQEGLGHSSRPVLAQGRREKTGIPSCAPTSST